jgi:hypothetical protein
MSGKAFDLKHRIEGTVSSIETAFYGLLQHPEEAKEYKELFEKSVKRIRELKDLIKGEVRPHEISG